MEKNIIKFGTSGWRAKIGEDFDVNNIRRVAHATALHVKENKIYGFKGEEYQTYLSNKGKKYPKNPLIIIGYDTRFYSENAAKIIAEVFAYHGINSIVSDIEAPTPTIAWLVMQNSAIGGVTITASHNPVDYNGYKWTPFWGGPATPEITDEIEQRSINVSNALLEKYINFEEGIHSKLIKVESFKESYIKQLKTLIDFEMIKKSKIKIVVDANNGASRTYLRPLLESYGITTIGIKENRDVYFCGHSPDTDEENLTLLKNTVIKNKFNIGIATDGDADRFGIIDSDGKWISPNIVLGLTLRHLVKNKKMKGNVARSVMTSHFVDAIAKNYNIEVRETPVGFKYIGELLKTGKVFLGGEESGGLSISNHVPEKDGLLACLLMVEMIAYEKKPIHKILDEINKELGEFHNLRLNFHLDKNIDINSITDKLSSNPPLSIAGMPIWRINNIDGFKFIMKDGSWMGLRPSGTEPIIRIYAESKDTKKLHLLLENAKKISLGKF